jgi:hypothetical protein
VTNHDDINWMRTRLSPMPWHTHDQPIRIANVKPKDFLKVISLVLNLEILNLRLKSHLKIGITLN